MHSFVYNSAVFVSALHKQLSKIEIYGKLGKVWKKTVAVMLASPFSLMSPPRYLFGFE